MSKLLIASRIIAGMVSAILIYSSLFLYESEEGNLQNKLVDLWIRIDDAQRYALAKHTMLMRSVASLITSGLNRIFGGRAFSIQSIGVSACYALAALFLTMIILMQFVSGKRAEIPSSFWTISLGALILGSIPAMMQNSLWIRIWFVFLCGIVLFKVAIPVIEISSIVSSSDAPQLARVLYLFLISFGIGIILFTLSVVLIRQVLRHISMSNSFLRMALISLWSLLPIILMYGLLKLLEFRLSASSIPDIPTSSALSEADIKEWFNNWSIIIDIFLVLAFILAYLTNLVIVLISSLFIILGLIMLLHRILWPTIQRPVYTLQRLGIAKRSKLVAALGTLLLVYALGGLDWLEKITDKLSPF